MTDITDDHEFLPNESDIPDCVVNSDKTNRRSPLRGRSDVPADVVHPTFSGDFVVWKGNNGRTQVPLHLTDDPFITGMVKYFNSSYFSVRLSNPASVGRYKQSFEYLLSVLDKEGMKQVPSNIYPILLSHLTSEKRSETNRYNIYTCLRSPALKMSSARANNRQARELALLRQIPITLEERTALSKAFKQGPRLAMPSYQPTQDLIEHLGLDMKAEELIKSIRAFSAFFILESQKIRSAIFSKFPLEVSRLIDFAKNLKASDRGGLIGVQRPSSDPYGTGIDVCFEITKHIDHPFLTERFVVEYLGANKPEKGLSKAAQATWDFDVCSSTSAQVNWLKKIPEQFYSGKRGGLCKPGQRNYKKLNPGSRNYPTLKREWVGKLMSPFPVRTLLGHSVSEQVCMAWIFASDRHQQSNLRLMTVGDLAITDNSISTILDPHTLKRRASRTSGTSYDEIGGKAGAFGSADGETYKRTQLIFKAIMAHRDQLIAASKNGVLTGEPFTGDIRDLWFFSEIRSPETQIRAMDGPMCRRFFQFWQSNQKNFELLLCAMEGSLSNQHVLKNCPEASLFLKAIRKAYLMGRDKEGTGFRSMGVGVSQVARLAVNSGNGKLYSEEFTPISDNNDPSISNEGHLREMVHDAALHNHSVDTKLSVYADKLPAYITKSSRFGARVGDEMVRMASQLGTIKLKNTSLMSMSQLRKKLGIETTTEKELEQINDLLKQVDLEGFSVDALGLMTNDKGKSVIIRHPITIALIQAALVSLDRHLNDLEYSNQDRLSKALMRYMYLKMILTEKFTPSEIEEARKLYGDVEFPMSDVLV